MAPEARQTGLAPQTAGLPGTRVGTIGRRIATMSPDEIWVRVLQAGRKRLDAARYRLRGRFASPRRSPDRGKRPGFFFFDAHELPQLRATLRTRLPDQAAAVVARAELNRRRRFDLLGYSGLDCGDPIDWHRDPVHGISAPRVMWFRVPYLDFNAVGDHKITWELNRHQHLVTLAKAAILTEDAAFVTELVSQWYHWREANPYPLGINWASSLEVSFRAIAWLWVVHLLEPIARLPNDFVEDVRDELGISATHIERYLSTYFAPNTHLLGEAVALFFLGVLCPMFRAAERWRTTGWNLVLDQARRQVRPDGVHFEQSIYYHVYALDFFLHARLLASRNGHVIPPWFDDTLKRMAAVLNGIALDGAVPRLGDDDGGRVFDPTRNRTEHLLDPLATCALLFDEAEWQETAGGVREETLWLLGAEAAKRVIRKSAVGTGQSTVAFPDGGIYSIATVAPIASRMVIDAGPHGMGAGAHGHADALSINLLIGGRQALGDPGTYSYANVGPDRNDFRGTAAHNTLRVDGLDQGDPCGPFAWQAVPTSHVERWYSGTTVDLFVGSHDGYHRLANPVTHRRWVISLRRGPHVIRDLAAGSGTHALEVFWHVGPDFTVGQPEAHRLVLHAPTQAELTLLSSAPVEWSRKVRQGSWSPVYGAKVTAPVVCFGVEAALPAELVTMLTAGLPDQGAGCEALSLEAVASTDAVSIYRAVLGTRVTTLWFSHSLDAWRWHAVRSDAQCLIQTRDVSRASTVGLVVVGGSYLQLHDGPILQCNRAVDVWEWWNEEGQEDTHCTDPSAVLAYGPALGSLWLLRNRE